MALGAKAVMPHRRRAPLAEGRANSGKLVCRWSQWGCGAPGPLVVRPRAAVVLLAARIRALIDEGELPAGARCPRIVRWRPRWRLAVARLSPHTTCSPSRAASCAVKAVAPGSPGLAAARPPATTDAPGVPAPARAQGRRNPVGVRRAGRPAAGTGPGVRADVPELADAWPAISVITRWVIGVCGARSPTRYAARGVPTTPDQILVTTGGQQALTLLARALIRPGDRVLVQTPTYSGRSRRSARRPPCFARCRSG